MTLIYGEMPPTATVRICPDNQDDPEKIQPFRTTRIVARFGALSCVIEKKLKAMPFSGPNPLRNRNLWSYYGPSGLVPTKRAFAGSCPTCEGFLLRCGPLHFDVARRIPALCRLAWVTLVGRHFSVGETCGVSLVPCQNHEFA